jgi:hypothetical protein
MQLVRVLHWDDRRCYVEGGVLHTLYYTGRIEGTRQWVRVLHTLYYTGRT